MTKNSIVTKERIEKKIYLIRNQKVMIDQDVAELYDVSIIQDRI